MTITRRLRRFAAIAFASAALAAPASAQTNIEVFGQNRVQYRTFDWKFFDTEHFRIYHYDASGRQLARYVAEQAEKDISAIERKLDGRFPKRLNIILYNNYDEVRQTNVGRKYEGQLQDNSAAGTVDMVGDQLVVYFTGVHTDLRRQLRAGMSRVVMERMLFGENFREIVKNAVLQNLPKWATTGYIAFLVDGWDAKSETDWKNLLAARPNTGFYELGDAQPELAGKAFWKYVSDNWGDERVKNLLYTMQMRNSVNQGMKMALGMKVKQAYDSVLVYYKNTFAKDELVQETPPTDSSILNIPVPKAGGIIKQIRVSPRNSDVAFVEFENGEFNVVLQRTSNQQQRSVIMSGGRKDWNEKQPDPDYPILAWSNSGYKLAILYKSGHKTRLRIYNAIKARIENYTIPPNRFDRALGLTFNEDDDKIVISAIKKSQTDLYNFTIKGSRIVNITNDLWDDVQPVFVSGGSRRGILFLSNRPLPNTVVPLGVNELPTGPMNLFFYDTKTQRKELLQCSFVTEEGITQPIQYGPDNFAYLNDQNGIRNKYVVVFGRTVDNLDSAISVPITNYSRSILNHQYNPASNSVADVLQIGDQYRVFSHPLVIPGINASQKELQPTTLMATPPAKSTVMPSGGAAANAGLAPLPSDSRPAVKGGTVFQSEFTDTITGNEVVAAPSVSRQPQDVPEVDTTNILDPNIKDSTYVKLKSQQYRLSFKPDFYSLRLDNSVLFNRYQSVDYNNGGFTMPNLGGMLTVSLNDALENHRITGGIRVQPTSDFSRFNPTYYLQYENFKRRWDWGLIFLRTEMLNNYAVTYIDTASGAQIGPLPQEGKVTMNMIQGSVSYPLDRIRRVGLHLGARQDNLNFKAQDFPSLAFADRQRQYWMMSRAEYVFDNSISPTQNIHVGYRYKFFAEYMYKLNEDKGGMYNLGVDFRYYHRIFKNTILATRAAFAHSAGDHNVLYFVGGVDNWIGAKQPRNAPISQDKNYSFQALATNMRGYEQGARNGNTYGLVNLELRSPILSTLIRRPIQSNLLRSLQLVAFTDVGSAWDGLLPNANNSTKPLYLTNPPVNVRLNAYGSTGLAMGFGPGIRAQLLGYFMRLDAAWNIDGRKKPILYFSLGTDF